MTLPAKGWKGYGRPGVPTPTDRQRAIARDNDGHTLREWAFEKWQRDTVFPDAVCRRIKEIGNGIV